MPVVNLQGRVSRILKDPTRVWLDVEWKYPQIYELSVPEDLKTPKLKEGDLIYCRIGIRGKKVGDTVQNSMVCLKITPVTAVQATLFT